MLDQTISSFTPISDSNSRVVILGSIPSVVSLKELQYYGYPRNQFWKIIFELFEPELVDQPHHEVPYQRKIELLKREGIALWDVIGTCSREGSLDADIKNEVPNDFESFFKEHPFLTHVVFNGSKAEAVYKKRVGLRPNLHYLSMPSTSPAYTLSYDKKLSLWKALKGINRT